MWSNYILWQRFKGIMQKCVLYNLIKRCFIFDFINIGGYMLNKRSMTYNYLKRFILMIVIPIIVINFVLYNIYINILLNNSSERILQSLNQMSVSIENEIKRITLTVSTLSNDDNLMELITQWHRSNNYLEKFQLSNQIDAKLSYLFNYTNSINSAMFFFKGEGLYYYKNNPNIDEKQLRDMEWYKRSFKNDEKVEIVGSLKSLTYRSADKYVISGSINTGLSQHRHDVELVYLEFDAGIFDKIYSQMSMNMMENIIIVGGDNKIMASKDISIIGKSLEEFQYLKDIFNNNEKSYGITTKDAKMFITTLKMERTNWRLVSVIDYKYLTKDIDKILRYVVILAAIIFIMFILFSKQFFQDIIFPINKLIRLMRIVEGGNFETSINIKGEAEVVALGKNFNRMVQEIKKLIQERDMKERERHNLEIEVLQSQITPHFITNTLNAIKIMAMIGRQDNIYKTTDAFMKLVSASFGKTKNLIRIEEELENIKNYIHIMKVRYGESFDIVYEVDEDIKEYYVLKLILQPIVENSILHGIYDKNGDGHISIRGYQEKSKIIFEVIDNGHGISQERIKSILSGERSTREGFTSIGVGNVDRRIKLNYDKGFGLEIESVVEKYTKVKMTLPIIGKDNGSESNE